MSEKVSAYVRESSDDTGKAPSIKEQIERIKQFVTEKGYNLINIYSDNGFSGGDWKRPAWNQLVKDARRHLFKIVIVWNQDRIARDTEQFLWFYRNLDQAHIKIYSLTDSWIDMTSLGDRVKHTSLAQASEIFRLVTSDKVKKAYESKKKKEGENFSWGRPKGKYDLDLIKNLRSKGKGYRQIAKQIGCSYQTIRRLLQNSPIEKRRNLLLKEDENL